jgi:hypothetical protein
MNRLTTPAFLLLAVALVALTGCGPKVALSPDLAKENSPYVALVPTNAPGTIQRERVAYLRELLKAELSERGYVLLEDDIVEKLCTSADCAISPEDAARYGLAGVFEFDLQSISRVNFLAGYYNALEGSLRFVDPKGRTLYETAHTQSERGGVVFESGQVIQGIINQARSGDESTIDALSLRFVNSLTKGLPIRSQTNTAEEVAIKTVELKQFRGENTELCAIGTPKRMAWLVAGADGKAQLREVTMGRYCGVFRLQGAWAVSKGLQVELRSAFGRASRLKVVGAPEAEQSSRTTVTGL